MARVLLISANTTTEPYPVYPLGMSVVANALTKAGHTVRQFDFLAEGTLLESLQSTLADFNPDMTGISLRNIDNVDSLTSDENWYLSHVRDVVTILKRHEQTVMVGGPGFSLLPEQVLDYLGADHGVVGEGETKMVRLVEMLEAKQNAPRIMKQEQGLSADEMLPPLWDKKILDFYQAQSGIMNVQSKRGCPHRCSYCSYPTIEGGRIRAREADDVVEEIKKLQTDFGANFVFFTDSVFNDPGGHFLELAEAMIKRKLDIKWSGFFQPTPLSQDELKLLKRAGLHAMEVGTDASTDTTLSAMNKPFSFDDVVRFNNNCVERRIPCSHFVIFGGPGENAATVKEGITNLLGLSNCVVFAFSGIRLHRGTPLFAQAVREGLVQKNAPLLEPHYYFSPDIDPDEMNDMLTVGFAGRRDRIFPPSDGQERMNVLRRFGYRGLLWDTLVNFDGKRTRRGTHA